MHSNLFESESNVRSYCRNFPVLLKTARNSVIQSSSGMEYIDFLAGAGSLNYGHNHPKLKSALLDYIGNDNITQSLDLYTEAKAAFIDTFVGTILAPRGLDYKLQFTGPTGTNAVEAALKLARLAKRRPTIGAFSNAFHGMSLGALAASGNADKRAGAGMPLGNVTFFPYDGYMGPNVDTVEYIERQLNDPSSGIAKPAAFIVETVQGEGGINIASFEWLRRLCAMARRNDILVIVDDIQAGCGRTGRFFSFEVAEIKPDIVCLSKSLGGYGLPLSLVLIAPELDIWKPGQHNGTFRGNNLGFVAATTALSFWSDETFKASLQQRVSQLHAWLESQVRRYGKERVRVRARGLIAGIEFHRDDIAAAVSAEAFERRVIVETCGARDQVLKFLPPLTIESDIFEEGLDRVAYAIDKIISKTGN
ncbi:diaminobutyrate--2-oxoglutarate transaminase [Paraburkholderia antibiotica]|uniref:Diaminobutyrate--2-oxoglutarate transaminase n=1 Tax=Paraburkholderia antibiotica TaxID=2728839 RepID=A0A7X9X5G1_9BURK|nr:diaminobutyrate--2-oxoglutarate transaminase [Paraburkholderia antibiotica]NML31760.1 diaminobutyrate--2-oxoglutarate transaminase [Paraburkholderia antibiotica]